MKNLYCGNNLYFGARNNSKGMKEKLKGHSAMFTANFLWGIMSPISKAIFLTGTISAFSLTNMRMAGAAILFWIASLFMPREPVTKRDLLLLFVASLFGITLNQGFFVLGLSYTTPIDASVVASLAPIITMILAAFIQKEPMTGKKVVVVGGGAVGLDVVEFFAARNAEISIVEMMDQIGRDLDPVTKNDMKDQMKKHHVAQLTKTALQEVKDSSFLVKDAEGERELPFDYGFVCLGMRAQGQLFAELSDAFVSDDVEILNIGDSKRARRIIDGTLEGRNILNTLTQMGYLQ